MNLGAHISISGGAYKCFARAKEVTANSIQIFVKNNNRWFSKPFTDKELERFQIERERYQPFSVNAHNGYLINLCSPKSDIEKKSISAMKDEISRCEQLKLPYLVMHPGSHLGKGEKWGISKIAENLNHIIEEKSGTSVKILLETTAGQGTNLGYTFEQLQDILDKLKYKERFGICYDTCHTFAAGYDITTPEKYQQVMENFNRIIGLHQIYLFHLNDSKKELGSRKDRHTHIGEGYIGLEGFRSLLNDKRFQHIPMILETPKGDDGDMDITNLGRLRGLRYRAAKTKS